MTLTFIDKSEIEGTIVKQDENFVRFVAIEKGRTITRGEQEAEALIIPWTSVLYISPFDKP